MTALVSILVSGLVLGSLYALVASGLSLIWSTLKVFNYAQGALLMFAAYLAWTVTDKLHGGIVVGVLVSSPIMAALAVIFERLLVRPFIRRPGGDLLVMVSTLAGATILVNLAQVIWGTQLKQLPTVVQGSFRFVGTALGANQLAAILIAPLAMIALSLFLGHTRAGTAVRAVEQNREFAQMVGISPERIYVLTIVLAVELATLAGALFGGIFFVTTGMGDDPLLKAFVVMVFGGLATLYGTVAGAYVVGMIEATSTYFVGLHWTPIILFGAMILVLVLRPEGLVVRRRVLR